tara:strand:+ start:1587 stop:1910 length:324 start_codon:yes stop_codon:yes gene_type:complete
MTIEQLISIAPKRLVRALCLDTLEDQGNMLQTRGDIEELHAIITVDVENIMDEGYASQVDRAIETKELMMNLCSHLGYGEARCIPRLASFKRDYESLYSTFECYAWS